MLKKLDTLRNRAQMLSEARFFFAERKVMEVDTPILSSSAAVDAHIDLLCTQPHTFKSYYLHSSPEYGMKRLLADGIGDIYQLSHVFREGEFGKRHNPEFTMAEWYRLGFTFQQMIEETVDFIRLFVGDLPFETLSYREIFQKYAHIDYLSISEHELVDYLQHHGIQVHPAAIEEGKESLLNIILGSLIEPKLGQDNLFVLAYYPASQAALAQTLTHGDEAVAERFEVYYKGIELANGYHELVNATEQRQRFEDANVRRKELGKDVLPIDENFLAALEKGLPDCCGVAVGFDRLMMLRSHAKTLAEVIPFAWDNA